MRHAIVALVLFALIAALAAYESRGSEFTMIPPIELNPDPPAIEQPVDRPNGAANPNVRPALGRAAAQGSPLGSSPRPTTSVPKPPPAHPTSSASAPRPSPPGVATNTHRKSPVPTLPPPLTPARDDDEASPVPGPAPVPAGGDDEDSGDENEDGRGGDEDAGDEEDAGDGEDRDRRGGAELEDDD